MWTMCSSCPALLSVFVAALCISWADHCSMDYLAFCGKTFDDSDESDETSEADDAYLESFLSKPDPDLKPPADKPDRTPKRMKLLWDQQPP